MGQTDLIRTGFDACEIITSSADLNKQLLAFTGYYKLNDTVEIWALDAAGCRVGSALATGLNIDAIQKDLSLSFDSSVDTSTALPAGAIGWYVCVNDIDDGQEAIDRLYRCYTSTQSYEICVNADSPSELDTPIVGQSRHLVDDISCFRVGDAVAVICDSGLVGTAIIISLNANADDTNNKSEIVLDTSLDTSGETGCQICSTALTVDDVISRLKENMDSIDRPCENEDLPDGDCKNNSFETADLFLAGTSHVYLDGRKLKLGTCGTRAFHTEGAGDSALTYTAMILGTDGNATTVSVTAGAGFTVTVTGTYAAGFNIDCTDNGGIATSQEIADAINADAIAKRLVQVQWGGDGTGVVAAFVATSLATGADDGTGDYCEQEQVFNNLIALTGYKWVSLHVRPNERNRLNVVPRDSEELVIDYRKAMTNK